MPFAGIDAGSRAIKIVIYDDTTDEISAHGIADQSVNINDACLELFNKTLADIRLDDSSIDGIAATGYARNIVEFADRTITEITCHARGVQSLIPDVRAIIEIGGQDSKVIKFDDNGVLYDFSMNDRCAAGTGRFIEMVASRFDTDIQKLGEMSVKSNNPASINSTCVVFAETEIIGLLTSGIKPEDIIAGVQNSIASRISTMAGRNIKPPVVFTGGVALVDGMSEALSKSIGSKVIVSPYPQFTGALGAAIIASENRNL